MRKQSFYLAAFALVFVFLACPGKNNDDDGNDGTTDVYVAGQGPTLWKNGAGQHISYHNADAFSVFVSGNDVYVAGIDYSGGGNNAVYWKNGAIHGLKDENYNSGAAYSIFVSGENVYIAGRYFATNKVTGRGRYVAVLWINGQPHPLTFNSRIASANSVFVSGDDVYVAGEEGYDFGGGAMLWKNGAPQSLSAGSIGAANSVFVSEGNVYVAGYDYSENRIFATLWKNGAPQSLSNISNPQAVFVSGDEVYVLGYDASPQGKSTAVVWKNGIVQRVSDGSRNAYAYSLFVSNGDVYVAGYEESANKRAVATLWKNGAAQSLVDEKYNLIAYSVYVVEKGD